MEPDRDEVLWRFAEEYQADPTALRRWSRRYPQYVEDFVAEIALSPGSGLQSCEEATAFSVAASGFEPNPVADRMLAAMRSAHDRRGNRLDSIVERARSLGLDPGGLSAALHVGKTIVAKLERRMLDPTTVPVRLLRRLSEILHVSPDSVRAYLDRPPTLAWAASYRADRAPRLQVTEDAAQYLMPKSRSMGRRSGATGDAEERPAEVGPADTTRESFTNAVMAAPDMPESQKNEWLNAAE